MTEQSTSVKVLAIHGIGNQRPDRTAALVRRLVNQHPGRDNFEVVEFRWSAAHRRPGGVKFLAWAIRMAPLIVYLSLLGDRRDKKSTSSTAKRTTLLVLAAIIGFLMADLQGAFIFGMAGLFISLPDRSRRLVTRIAFIIGPAIAVGLFINISAALAVGAIMIVLPILVARQNFLGSVALVGDGSEIHQIVTQLASLIDKSAGSVDRIIVVAHSMGAYLLYETLWLLAKNDSAVLEKISVLTLGSGLRPLGVLKVARQKRSIIAFGWLFMGGTLLALAGGLVLTAFIAHGYESYRLDDSWFTRWLSFPPYESNPAFQAFQALQQLPIGRNIIPLVVLPPGASTLAILSGIAIARWSSLNIRKKCDSLATFRIPKVVNWLDCSSVHDSVGRGRWPSVVGAQHILLPGIGLPLLDHPLSRYLQKTNPVTSLFIAMLDGDPRKARSEARIGIKRYLYLGDLLERQRDAYVVAGIGMLYGLLTPSMTFFGVFEDGYSPLFVPAVGIAIFTILGSVIGLFQRIYLVPAILERDSRRWSRLLQRKIVDYPNRQLNRSYIVVSCLLCLAMFAVATMAYVVHTTVFVYRWNNLVTVDNETLYYWASYGGLVAGTLLLSIATYGLASVGLGISLPRYATISGSVMALVSAVSVLLVGVAISSDGLLWMPAVPVVVMTQLSLAIGEWFLEGRRLRQ